MNIPEIDYKELITVLNRTTLKPEEKVNIIIKYRDRMWLRALGFDNAPNDYYVQEAVHEFIKTVGLSDDGYGEYLY